MIEHKLSLEGLSVCIGMPATRDIPPLTVRSLLATYDLCNKVNVKCQYALISGNAVIQWARDEVVSLFLKSDANRLFWIDSDITWEAHDFMRLLALSQEKDIVCGAYVAKKDDPTFYARWDGEVNLDEYGLFEVDGVGLGFCVMNREVIQKLYDNATKIKDSVSGNEFAEIFRVGHTREFDRIGEDMAFFEDVRNLGYKINLDPSVNLGHCGMKIYSGSMLDALGLAA